MPIDPITKNDMSQVTIKTSIELKDAEKKNACLQILRYKKFTCSRC